MDPRAPANQGLAEDILRKVEKKAGQGTKEVLCLYIYIYIFYTGLFV